MVKRVITKITLSTLVLAGGLFFWSNSNTNIASANGIAESNDVAICIPGSPTYPKCRYKEKD